MATKNRPENPTTPPLMDIPAAPCWREVVHNKNQNAGAMLRDLPNATFKFGNLKERFIFVGRGRLGGTGLNQSKLSKMLAHISLKDGWKFTLTFMVAATGCMSVCSSHPKKTEKFWLVFNKDTINVAFSVDSSLMEMESVIQWGCLKCFGYKNNEAELYFNFFEDQSSIVSRLSDSVVTSYIKNQFKTIEPTEGKLIKMEKISNNNLYGYLGEFERPEGRVSIFVGEFVSIHLSFKVTVFHSIANQNKPEMLRDILDSLKITDAR